MQAGHAVTSCPDTDPRPLSLQQSFIPPASYPALTAPPGLNQIRGQNQPALIRLRLITPTRLYSTDLGDTQQDPVSCCWPAFLGPTGPHEHPRDAAAPKARKDEAGVTEPPRSPHTATSPGVISRPAGTSLPLSLSPGTAAPRGRRDPPHTRHNRSPEGPHTGWAVHTAANQPLPRSAHPQPPPVSAAPHSRPSPSPGAPGSAPPATAPATAPCWSRSRARWPRCSRAPQGPRTEPRRPRQWWPPSRPPPPWPPWPQPPQPPPPPRPPCCTGGNGAGRPGPAPPRDQRLPRERGAPITARTWQRPARLHSRPLSRPPCAQARPAQPFPPACSPPAAAMVPPSSRLSAMGAAERSPRPAGGDGGRWLRPALPPGASSRRSVPWAESGGAAAAPVTGSVWGVRAPRRRSRGRRCHVGAAEELQPVRGGRGGGGGCGTGGSRRGGRLGPAAVPAAGGAAPLRRQRRQHQPLPVAALRVRAHRRGRLRGGSGSGSGPGQGPSAPLWLRALPGESCSPFPPGYSPEKSLFRVARCFPVSLALCFLRWWRLDFEGEIPVIARLCSTEAGTRPCFQLLSTVLTVF